MITNLFIAAGRTAEQSSDHKGYAREKEEQETEETRSLRSGEIETEARQA